MSKRVSTRTIVVSKSLRKVDQETRREIRDKRLQTLEADNYAVDVTTEAEDDYSDEEETLSRKKKTKAKGASGIRSQRKVRDLDRIIDSQNIRSTEEYLYVSIAAQPSLLPSRQFCTVCGNWGIYSCVRCGSRFCSMKCNTHHKETRCLKFSL